MSVHSSGGETVKWAPVARHQRCDDMWSSNRGGTAFAIAFAVTFAAFFWGTPSLILTDLLVYDDHIYVGKAFANAPDIVRSAPIPHLLLYAISSFDSVALLKLVWLAIHSAAAGTAAALLARHGGGLILPAAAGIALVALPVAADQVIFVTGSHPTVALLILLIALFKFSRIDTDGWRAVGGCIAIVVLLFLAALSSPAAFLAPVALPLWLVMREVRMRRLPGRGRLQLPMVVGVGTVLLGYATMSIGRYHYSGLVGWTKVSVGQIGENLLSGAARALAATIAPNVPVIAIHLLVGLGLAGVVWESRRRGSLGDSRRSASALRLRALGWNALVLSALTFGPASITTNLLDRYLVLPVVFAFFFLGAQLFSPLNYASGAGRIVCIGGMALIAGSYAVQSRNNRHRFFQPFMATHAGITGTIESDKRMWPTNAQILMVTSPGCPSPSLGFNHWSTWYLRRLASMPELIALVGPAASASTLPFVDDYRDHGPEYWTVFDGKSRRLTMVGLERDRPLYSYLQASDGSFKRIDRLLVGQGGVTRAIEWGRLPAEAAISNVANHGDDGGNQLTLLWPGSEASSASGTDGEEGVTFFGRESNDVVLDFAPGSSARISFRLVSSDPLGKTEYSETTPPMPVLAGAVAIYQHPRGFLIFDRGERQIWPVTADKRGAEIEFVGVEGSEIAVRCNGTIVGRLSRPAINGTWTFGKGFKARYWRGTVYELTLGE